MDTATLVILVMASVLVVVGMVLIVAREITSQVERRVVGRVRDIAEVLLPLLGALALLVVVWRSV